MIMVEFHPQSTQVAVDKQYYMNSRNERWIMRLKAITGVQFSQNRLLRFLP